MSSCITDPAAAAWAAKSAVSRATSIRSLSDAAVTVQRRWRLTRRMPYARPHQPAFHEATVQRRPQKVQWRVAPPPSQRQRRKAQQRAAPPPPRSNPHVVVMAWTPNAPNAPCILQRTGFLHRQHLLQQLARVVSLEDTTQPTSGGARARARAQCHPDATSVASTAVISAPQRRPCRRVGD